MIRAPSIVNVLVGGTCRRTSTGVRYPLQPWSHMKTLVNLLNILSAIIDGAIDRLQSFDQDWSLSSFPTRGVLLMKREFLLPTHVIYSYTMPLIYTARGYSGVSHLYAHLYAQVTWEATRTAIDVNWHVEMINICVCSFQGKVYSHIRTKRWGRSSKIW